MIVLFESPDIFMNELMLRQCIPCTFWDNKDVMDDMQDVFHEFDNSIVGAARRLKTELGRYFSQSGKFVWHSISFVFLKNPISIDALV